MKEKFNFSKLKPLDLFWCNNKLCYKLSENTYAHYFKWPDTEGTDVFSLKRKDKVEDYISEKLTMSKMCQRVIDADIVRKKDGSKFTAKELYYNDKRGDLSSIFELYYNIRQNEKLKESNK
jgi:hypothetical protein